DLLWKQYYNGPGDGEDIPTAIVVDKLGDVFTTGKSYGIGTGSSDFATVKYGASGNLKWVHRYDGPSNGWDWGTDMAVFKSGEVYVTGRSDGIVGAYSDFLTIKFEFRGLKGDLNLDGSLSATDVVLMLSCAFLGEPPPSAPSACDINCDGKITPADVVILLNMVFASATAPC
ncbi:MAG: dockerin type I repeat-containing protein, partial [Candidatus Zixiibacteriota bacterium]